MTPGSLAERIERARPARLLSAPIYLLAPGASGDGVGSACDMPRAKRH
jgi:hypothetical protein